MTPQLRLVPQPACSRVFVTVGAQTPFDRLIAAVDRWAAQREGTSFLAQIGNGSFVPSHMHWTRFLSPAELGRAYDDADAVIGHAGTGTLLAALERGKRILVMPRRAGLRETRNEHQLATARRFAALYDVDVAWDEHELSAHLLRLDDLAPGRPLTHAANGSLVRTLAAFIDED